MSNNHARRDFMKRFTIGAALLLPAATLTPAAAAAVSTPGEKDKHPGPFFNVVEFGAVGDGKTPCTVALQKAVDVCAQAGGGKVIIPAGRYLTSALFLKSNVHVEILAGAILLFTTDFDSVPTIQGRWEGIDRSVYASLFTGADLENVSITGRGTLDGQGEAWWKAFRTVRDLRRKMGLDDRESENPPGSLLKWGRPRMINLYRSKNVLISGVTLINSPSWNIHPVLCQNVCIDGVTILAPADGPNTDGIDPDSCKDVRISNCAISVGDDCIIIKSGYRYQERGVPSENITVTNCVFGTGHCGVGVGSETAGGVKNVAISNCVCDGTDRGLRFKTARGRGNVVENVRASNVVMRNVGEAVTVTMFYTGGDTHTAQPVNEGTPAFRNFHFSEITATRVKRPVLIEGLPEMPIQGLSVSNMVVEDAASGITCTNVTGLTVDNVRVNAGHGPALVVDGVREIEVYRFTTRQPKGDQPVIRFENVNDAVLHSCTAAEGTGTFLELRGTTNRDVSLMGNRLMRAAREVEFTAGASETALSKRT
ncbi:MAG: glycoside hydrolase family 28 protein [Acidobacteriia bacterium]|nr:glycoside hydrolase family 28 protein [Terriglobia bacterium]